MGKGSRRASDMRAREQEFLWYGRLPVGHATAICGSPRMGKSTLGYRIAADVNVNTLFVSTEEVDESVWLPRLLVAGVDPEKAWHHPEVRLTKSTVDLDYLSGLIDEYAIKLIVIDPVQNHLGVSISHDQAVRDMVEPYLKLIQRKKVALLLEAHVLRDIKTGADPLLAIPAGLRGWIKAGYLFGKDPSFGADPDFCILATAKFNFGADPESRRFEFGVTSQSVIRASGGGRVNKEFGMWYDRGEVKISAKALLVTLSPETKERKSDRVAWELINFLRTGEGAKQSVVAVRKMIDTLDPPTSWRTVERVAKELGIEMEKDPKDARKRWWILPDHILATLEEATEEGDIVTIEEVDIPDTIPSDWMNDGESDESDDDDA